MMNLFILLGTTSARKSVINSSEAKIDYFDIYILYINHTKIEVSYSDDFNRDGQKSERLVGLICRMQIQPLPVSQVVQS
jgi:hypothetical protein